MSVTNALKNSASYDIGDKDYDEDYGVLKWRKLKINDDDPKLKERFDKFVRQPHWGSNPKFVPTC